MIGYTEYNYPKELLVKTSWRSRMSLPQSVLVFIIAFTCTKSYQIR